MVVFKLIVSINLQYCKVTAAKSDEIKDSASSCMIAFCSVEQLMIGSVVAC